MKVFNIFCFVCIKSIMCNPFHNLSRIIAGVDCSFEEYPYIVTIMLRHVYNHVCGGTAVKPLWVLTAAHCFITTAENLIVISGSLSMADVKASQEIQVLASYSHPEYKNLHNDIGLLRLKEELHENEKLQYISLSTEAFTSTFVNSCSNTLVMGHGSQTRRTIEGVTTSPYREDNKLKCANLSVISDSKCDELVHRYTGHFCAMDLSNELQDVCSGDSGGPLICNGKQIGIVSAGYACGHGTPALYTKVSSYIEFIEYTIANRGSNEIPMKGIPLLSSLFLGIL